MNRETVHRRALFLVFIDPSGFCFCPELFGAHSEPVLVLRSRSQSNNRQALHSRCTRGRPRGLACRNRPSWAREAFLMIRTRIDLDASMVARRRIVSGNKGWAKRKSHHGRPQQYNALRLERLRTTATQIRQCHAADSRPDKGRTNMATQKQEDSLNQRSWRCFTHAIWSALAATARRQHATDPYSQLTFTSADSTTPTERTQGCAPAPRDLRSLYTSQSPVATCSQ